MNISFYFLTRKDWKSMKEIISFFTLAFSSFKFIRKYFDGKRMTYYLLIIFNFIFSLVCGSSIYYIDGFLWNEISKPNLFLNVLITLELLLLFILVLIFSATYAISLNHFILYVDNKNFVFERKNIALNFNKELLKVNSEKKLINKYIRNHSIYQYIYNYQVEEFEYIDQESRKYNEFVCQQVKFNYKRLFKYSPQINLYLKVMTGLYVVTLAIIFLFYSYYLLTIVMMIHTLIYISSIGFLIRISVSLHKENDKDKVKMMRFVRSLKNK